MAGLGSALSLAPSCSGSRRAQGVGPALAGDVGLNLPLSQALSSGQGSSPLARLTLPSSRKPS